MTTTVSNCSGPRKRKEPEGSSDDQLSLVPAIQQLPGDIFVWICEQLSPRDTLRLRGLSKGMRHKVDHSRHIRTWGVSQKWLEKACAQDLQTIPSQFRLALLVPAQREMKTVQGNCGKLIHLVYLGCQGNNGLSAQDIDAIVAHQGIRSLEIRSNVLPVNAIHALTRCPVLTSLKLSFCQLQAEDMKCLVQLPTLKHLDVSFNPIRNEGVKHLTQNLGGLASVNLTNTEIGHDGVAHLSRNAAYPSVRLGYNHLTDDSALQLSQNTALTSLDLRSNSIGDRGAQYLGQNSSLTALDLRANQIGPEGARGLALAPKLTSLILKYNNVQDEGVIALSKNKNSVAFTLLDLRWNAVGQKGADCLSQNKSSISSLWF